MKVVLALAPVWESTTPPLSLAFLKSSLVHAGFDAFCIDFSVQFRPIMVSAMGDVAAEEYIAAHPETYKNWAKQIADQKPDVVGFSILMSNIKNTALLAQEVRKLLPEATIVAGGPSLTRENMKYIKYTFRFSDIIVEGEGEIIFTEIMRCLQSKGDIKKLKQLWLKDELGNISYTGSAPLHPIDNFHYPDFKDFGPKDYPVKNKLPLLFSRGCILNCNYCENKWNHLTQRSRSGKNVFDELKRNVREYDMKEYIFNDDSLISSKTMRQMEEYADLVIAEDLVMPWHVYGTRVERLLTDQFVAKLRKTGMYRVSLGIESFSSKVQKEMGKSSRYDDADKCARLFGGNGIKTETWIIYGYPTETDAEFLETLNWFIQNPKILSHVTANTFGPNAKYQHDKPGGIQYASSNAWDWYGSESTLQKRKERFLLLADVLEGMRKSSKGEFTFHIGDPYYVKYFNSFTSKDKRYLLDSWEQLEGTYVEKNAIKKLLLNMGWMQNKKPVTMIETHGVDETDDLNTDENLNLIEKHEVSYVNLQTFKEVIKDATSVDQLRENLLRNLERELFEIRNMEVDAVTERIKYYETKLDATVQLMKEELPEKVLIGITYRENPKVIVNSLNTTEPQELAKEIRKHTLPLFKKASDQLQHEAASISA